MNLEVYKAKATEPNFSLPHASYCSADDTYMLREIK